MVGAGGYRELVFNGDRVSIWEDGQVQKTDVVMVAQECERM